MRPEEAPVGRQKDMGGTVLHMLKGAVGHPALNLGSHAEYVQKYPFLRLYWG